MNTAVAIRPELSPDDRLGLTFCLAVIIHAIVILGIVFAPEDKIRPRYESMEIVLVQQSSELEDEAKILAQANLRGGGDVSQEIIPGTPLPPPLPDNQAEVVAVTEMQLPEPLVEPEAPVDTTQPSVEAVEQLAVEAETTEAAPEESPDKTEENRPSATTLLTNSLRMAALSSEVKRKLEAKAERPKRIFISANTREYKYAAYMEAWRAKVERVGNLNYPEEARKRNISGQLILDVALNPDGKINQITIRRSSGHKILDDAAIRIVELAAPYAPFPKGIRAEADILHITRTWQFLDNRGFR